MKKAIYLLLVSLSFLTINIPKVSATHLITADLGWTCIGQDSFMIKLTIYVDCNVTGNAFSPINFYCAQTGASLGILSLSASSWVDVTPICNSSCTRCQSAGCSFPYGIKRYIMQGLVDFTGTTTCCQIKMAWEQTARSSNITTGAANTPLFTEAIFDRCQAPGYSSPQFSNDPVDITCVGGDVTFALGAYYKAPESKDSCTYEWGNPMSTISYTGFYDSNKAVYFWGFPNNNLPFPRGLHLDPQTGDIQFRPMKAEVTIMAVKVQVFQNNVKISELWRELFLIVITCTNNNPPMVSTPNNIRSKSVCAGETVSFNFTTTDANVNDTVNISWNKAVPGAIWIDSNGLSKHSGAILTWTPTEAQVRSLPYTLTFTVTAKDNACPVNASFTQAYQFKVNPRPRANIIVTDSGCGNFWFRAQSIVGSGPVYLWQGQSFTFKTNTGPVVQHKFQPGRYPYSVMMAASGCITTYFDTVSIMADSFVSVRLPEGSTICKGNTVSVTPAIFFGKGPIKYKWSNGDTNKILQTGPINNDKIIKLTVTDVNGCVASDTIKFELFPQIDTSLQVNGLAFTASPGMKRYEWYRNDTLISWDTTNSLIAYSNGRYFAIMTDSHDCTDTSRTVTIILTDIRQQIFNGAIKLYPNPTSGKLILETGMEIKGEIGLSLFNMFGKEIMHQTLKTNDIQTFKEIDISHQPAGLYTVVIRYQNNNFRQLIIKE